MARIPDDELARLKQNVAIEHLAAASGIALKPTGTNLLGLCPFHRASALSQPCGEHLH